MSRLIAQERRIRAVAAIEGVLGLTLVGPPVVMLATGYLAGGNGIGAIVALYVAGAAIFVGAVALLAAVLTWSYRPAGPWLIALTLVPPAAECVFIFFRYSIFFLWKSYRFSYHADLIHYLWGAAIEVAVVAWTALALFALFGPGSRRVFSREYREAHRGDRVPAFRCLTSPYFPIGLLLCVVVGLGFAFQ